MEEELKQSQDLLEALKSIKMGHMTYHNMHRWL